MLGAQGAALAFEDLGLEGMMAAVRGQPQGNRVSPDFPGRRSLEAGFEWRGAGCSMCLAMNPDKLVGDELCASSSNRNFKGRQGSATGRTVLMSPVMVAAAAVTGVISDAREVFGVSDLVSA